MIGIKVYTSNGSSALLELASGTQLTHEFLLPSFDDLLDGSDFSLPIQIPFTDQNRNILGFPDHFNTIHASIPDDWRCDVFDDGTLWALDARLKLLSHSGRFDFRDGTYSFSISGTKGFLGARIKNKRLKDLELDGRITWDPSLDSREFAKDLMDGNQPAYADRISFAPVAMTDFFDITRNDYAGEIIIDEIVNNIIVDAAFPNGWIFGRYKPLFPNVLITKGNPGYEDYRTIPFYNLHYVLRKIFTEHGFTVEGNFFDSPNLSELFIFNNYAIEKYDDPFSIDLNTEILPANHMPDQLIVDFLVAVQNTFNLEIKFQSGFNAIINFKEEKLSTGSIQDIMPITDTYYENAVRHRSYCGGFALKWAWDGNDTLHNDRVKDMRDKTIVAETETLADLLATVFAFTLNNSHFALVHADNYYYTYNTTLGTWEPYSENQRDLEDGNMELVFQPPLSPLCQHYALDIPLNQIVNKNKCGTRMFGSYLNTAKEPVQNPFETRIFFIQKQSATGITDMPASFSHNYDSNGVKLAAVSLSWRAKEGLYNCFWQKWMLFLQNSFEIRTKALFKITELARLNEADILRIGQSMFLLKKYATTLPVGAPTELELVKL